MDNWIISCDDWKCSSFLTYHNLMMFLENKKRGGKCENCFSNREGSLTCFFWLALQVPKDQHVEVTVEEIKDTLYNELLISFNRTGYLSYQNEYKIDPESLILLGRY